MKVTATTTITCEIGNSSEAHTLGEELENRLVTTLNALIPSLRNAQQIQSGEVRISVKVEGRTLRIRNTGRSNQDNLTIEGVEGQK